jgi:hypothetical protein
MSILKNKSIIVVGTVRNVETIITSEISRCYKALSNFKSVYFYLVESDSNDRTLLVLENLKNTLKNFNFKSLGKLETKIPDRLERIRFCRNDYVHFIRSLEIETSPNYVMVADLDGMNSALKSNSVASCFTRNDWDAVVANQTFGYYDILALRHPNWQVNDWTEEFKTRKDLIIKHKASTLIDNFKYFIELEKLKQQVLYSKMIRIRKTSPWIQIDSGFGGNAIYKTEVFLKHDYTKEFDTKETDHVSLHRKIVRDGGSVYINPKFINSHFNTYNINKFYTVRVIRNFIWSQDFLYNSSIYKAIKKLFRLL